MRPLALPDLRDRTILVVDDNDDALEMLGTFLRVCGAYVLHARGGDGALAYIDTHPHIDAMITDLAMPGMDGVELVRRLRNHPSRRSMPVIALTGFHESYMDTKDFTAFFRKPVNLDDLCNALATAIA
ncbi:MAG TPA: response regulator [Methylomirabilota bacterium]|jgi:CheY-like chemotaxis protein|nr:response regulator [Methylomirabilota bacterium]